MICAVTRQYPLDLAWKSLISLCNIQILSGADTTLFINIEVCPHFCISSIDGKNSKALDSVFTVGEEMGYQIFNVIFRFPSLLSEGREGRPDLGAANCHPVLSGCLL